MKYRWKYRSRILFSLASALCAILLQLYSCAPQVAQPLSQPQVIAAKSAEKQKVSEEKKPDATVEIRNFKFEPATIKIKTGQTIRFVNEDEDQHTATAQDISFDSKALDTGQAYTHTFTKAGSYPYICAVHPFMKGTITVTAKGEK